MPPNSKREIQNPKENGLNRRRKRTRSHTVLSSEKLLHIPRWQKGLHQDHHKLVSWEIQFVAFLFSFALFY